jgi:hypothetical protein
VIEWTKSEEEELDRKTLNMYKGLQKIWYLRLYLPWQKDGRGLKEVKTTIEEEKQGVDEYLWRKKDSEPLLIYGMPKEQSCHQTPRKSGETDGQLRYWTHGKTSNLFDSMQSRLTV